MITQLASRRQTAGMAGGRQSKLFYQQCLQLSPLVFCVFDEASGDFLDLSGNGHDGSPAASGIARQQTGIAGRDSVLLDGANGYIDFYTSALNTALRATNITAGIASAVWAEGTRTLTSGGGGATAHEIWEYETRELTQALGAAAADIWSYETRTITQAAASVVAAVSGSDLAGYQAGTFYATLTGLGSIADYTKLLFTVKATYADPDSEAWLQVQKATAGTGDGLLVAAGASPASAANGSITIDDEDNGDLTIEVSAAEMAKLQPRSGLIYDIKIIRSGNPKVYPLTEGSFAVNDAATKATA